MIPNKIVKYLGSDYFRVKIFYLDRLTRMFYQIFAIIYKDIYRYILFRF